MRREKEVNYERLSLLREPSNFGIFIMSASSFNLRGISPEVMASLKREAKKLHISVNALVLKMIERDLGLVHERPIYNDLDHLAGSWSAAEEKCFKKNTQPFEIHDS
jgi:hypothetical protein